MIAPRGSIARVILIAALALVAGACSSSDEGGGSATTTLAPTTTAVPGDAPVATGQSTPASGDCLEPMTQPMATSAQLPAIVSCDDPHGGEIVSVLELPTPQDGSYPASSSRVTGADEQIDTCAGSASEVGDLAEFLGSTPLTLPEAQQRLGATDAYAVSGVQYAVFVPGPAAWNAGKRWMACAAVLSNSTLTPSSYTGSLGGALSKPGSLDVQFSWCKQQEAGERETFTVVPCTQPHNFEQLAAFTAGADDATFPGDDALAQLSEAACPVISSEATGKRSDELPAGIGLGWTYPLESEWADGDHVVRCFAVTELGATVGAVSAGTADASSG